MARGDISCKVHKSFGIINGKKYISGSLYSYELNLVSWNDSRDASFDLRGWNENIENPCSKGTTFNLEEAKKLYAILGNAIEEMEMPVIKAGVSKPKVELIKHQKSEVSV